MSDGRTHAEDCWAWPGHHECAIARVRELEAARSPGGRERAAEPPARGPSVPEGSEGAVRLSRVRAVDSAAPEFRTDEGEETREVRDALADLARFVRDGADCRLCGRPLGETHDDLCPFGVVSMHVLLTTEPLSVSGDGLITQPARLANPDDGSVRDLSAADTPLPTASAPSDARGGWQPIETAPKDGSSVLVATHDGQVGEAWFYEPDGAWWWQNNHPTDQWGAAISATHWQPLPAPPEPGPEAER